MDADLVTKAGVTFKAVPAAGVHGVGLHRLPRNITQVLRGFTASRKVIRDFRPDVMFFTGGYVAVPMAFAGMNVPTALYVPDIEPGMALKVLALFADRIAVTATESREFFRFRQKVTVTGYPIRKELTAWKIEDAYRSFGFSPDLPTLLVTGGSLGSLSINKALAPVLSELLAQMQIIHLTGKLTWPQFKNIRQELPDELKKRYCAYPYLHEEMGAAFTIADLVLSRAGASSLGEYSHFGIPSILVPYPHAWRYQKVNADYLADRGAALIVEDAELAEKIASLIVELMGDPERREQMRMAVRSLTQPQAAKSIAQVLIDLANVNNPKGN